MYRSRSEETTLKHAQDNALTLQAHLVHTYLGLRVGIAFIGACLPIVLWAGDRIWESHGLRPSMSDYYWSAMRDPFVGGLVAIGVFLYLYKGFSTLENWALNAAGILAVGVAMVPMRAPEEAGRLLRSEFHYTFAIIFFLCIGYVCIFEAPKTLSEDLIPDRARAARLRRFYKTLGILMVALPLFALAVSGAWWKFWVEAAGVWVFSTYWAAKGFELAKTDADLLAVQGRLQRKTNEPGLEVLT